MTEIIKKRVNGRYLPILLSIILFDEVSNNYLIGLFGKKTDSLTEQMIFYCAFLSIQIISSPFQSGFSDFYCRKKSILFSLIATSVSLIFCSMFFYDKISHMIPALIISGLVKSFIGNNRPLAWAGIADINKKDYRLSLGLSTTAIALGYLVLLALDRFCEKKIGFIILIASLGLFLITFINFYDLLDRNKIRENTIKELPKKESKKKREGISLFFKLISIEFISIKNNFLSCNRFRWGIFGVFLPLEISFYAMHALGVDFAIEKFEIVTLSMIFGYITGVLFLKINSRKTDHTLIKKGYTVSIIFYSIMLFLTFQYPIKELNTNLKYLISSCYFMYSFGVAFIVPSLFAILSKEKEVHEQGKIYGLIDSTDTFALLIALLSGVIYSYLENLKFICLTSFCLFLFSFIGYKKFHNTNPKRIVNAK